MFKEPLLAESLQEILADEKKLKKPYLSLQPLTKEGPVKGTSLQRVARLLNKEKQKQKEVKLEEYLPMFSKAPTPAIHFKYDIKLITYGYVRVYLSSKSFKKCALQMLSRIFLQKNVLWVEVNLITHSLLVHYKTSFKAKLLEKPYQGEIPFVDARSFNEASFRKIKFYKIGHRLTNWEIVHEIPERMRIRHPLLYKRSAMCTRIERTLSKTPGIVEFRANPMTATVLVLFQKDHIKKEQIIQLLDDMLSSTSIQENKKDAKKFEHFDLSTTCFGLALMIPEAFLTLPIILWTALPIFKKAMQAVKKKKIKVDILDTVVITGSLVAEQNAIAAFMVWVVSLADKIQDNTSKSTGKLLSNIFGSQPRFAWIKEGDHERQVAIVDLKKGDVIIAHVGEAIPNDGEVVGGEALVDQSALTGESQPVEKHKGDKVFSCTTLVSGNLSIKVEKTGENTIAGQIQKVITQAASHKTKAQSIGEKIADRAVIPTLALGGIAMATGGPSTALAVVNCDFGTGIRVAAPTALLAHLVSLARKGILVKNGEVLDKISKTDVFIFDKTGTLTKEVPEVSSMVSLTRDFSDREILKYAAIAEQHVSHPIAKSILDKARECKLVLPAREDAKSHIGLGVEVNLNGDNVKVGSVRYMVKEKIIIPHKVEQELLRIQQQGFGVVTVAFNNKLAGFVSLKNHAREDSYDVIKLLKARGVKETVLISGDQRDVTKSIASDLGIDQYHGEVLPHQKADFVRMYKKQGKIVAMVGDGINDGPALSVADVSISLKGASEVAMDTAQVIFLDGNFNKIQHLFDSSHNFNKGVWSNFRLIAIPNVICIAGALTNVWGFGMSLIMNNCFNMIATIKALGPLYSLEDSSAKSPTKN